MSNGGGNFDRMSAASSSITSADDFPPPPVWRGRVNKMLSNNWRDWEKDKEIYAQELKWWWLYSETNSTLFNYWFWELVKTVLLEDWTLQVGFIIHARFETNIKNMTKKFRTWKKKHITRNDCKIPLMTQVLNWPTVTDRCHPLTSWVSFWSLVMSAFSWRPNTSGWGMRGKSRM